MKKKNKKNHIRKRFSTILLCCLAIVLCAAPALQADSITVPANETRDINDLVDGVLRVEFNGTANLLTGASVTQSIYVLNGGTLNMYSGTVGWFISVSPGASMTVYGTGFTVDDHPCNYGEVTLTETEGMGTLKGSYGDGSSINLWVWSNIAINLQPPPSGDPITIDIKPGGNPNNINLRSNGVVPVAVLTTDDFDASTIDPEEDVLFAGAEPVRWKLEDVDEDGDLDMLFHFKTQDLAELDASSTEATLTATLIGTTTNTMTSGTTAGEVVQGTDDVCIKSGKEKK